MGSSEGSIGRARFDITKRGPAVGSAMALRAAPRPTPGTPNTRVLRRRRHTASRVRGSQGPIHTLPRTLRRAALNDRPLLTRSPARMRRRLSPYAKTAPSNRQGLDDPDHHYSHACIRRRAPERLASGAGSADAPRLTPRATSPSTSGRPPDSSVRLHFK